MPSDDCLLNKLLVTLTNHLPKENWNVPNHIRVGSAFMVMCFTIMLNATPHKGTRDGYLSERLLLSFVRMTDNVIWCCVAAVGDAIDTYIKLLVTAGLSAITCRSFDTGLINDVGGWNSRSYNVWEITLPPENLSGIYQSQQRKLHNRILLSPFLFRHITLKVFPNHPINLENKHLCQIKPRLFIGKINRFKTHSFGPKWWANPVSFSMSHMGAGYGVTAQGQQFKTQWWDLISHHPVITCCLWMLYECIIKA